MLLYTRGERQWLSHRHSSKARTVSWSHLGGKMWATSTAHMLSSLLHSFQAAQVMHTSSLCFDLGEGTHRYKVNVQAITLYMTVLPCMRNSDKHRHCSEAKTWHSKFSTLTQRCHSRARKITDLEPPKHHCTTGDFRQGRHTRAGCKFLQCFSQCE